MEEFEDVELGSFLTWEEKVWIDLLGQSHSTSLMPIYFGALLQNEKGAW